MPDEEEFDTEDIDHEAQEPDHDPAPLTPVELVVVDPGREND